jgi:hypothetical protein
MMPGNADRRGKSSCHILCQFVALAEHRKKIFGSVWLEPIDIRGE